jgi:hypothetical protein
MILRSAGAPRNFKVGAKDGEVRSAPTSNPRHLLHSLIHTRQVSREMKAAAEAIRYQPAPGERAQNRHLLAASEAVK